MRGIGAAVGATSVKLETPDLEIVVVSFALRRVWLNEAEESIGIARCCMLKQMILEKLWDPKAKKTPHKKHTAAHTQSLTGKQNTLFSHSTFSTSGKLTCGRSNIGQAWAQIWHGSVKWPAALSRENTWDDSFTNVFFCKALLRSCIPSFALEEAKYIYYILYIM